MTTLSPASYLRRLRRMVMVAAIAAAFVPTASVAWASTGQPPGGPGDEAQPELGCPANPDLCPPPGPGDGPDDGPPPPDPCENPVDSLAGHPPEDCEPECPDPTDTLTTYPADPRCEPECPDPTDTLAAEPAEPQCPPPPGDPCEPSAGEDDECDEPEDEDEPVDPAIPARPTFTG